MPRLNDLKHATWFNLAAGILLGLVAAFFLFPSSGGNGGESAAGGGGGATAWTCSMHPQIQQPDPGDCPICGMDLIPLSDDGGGDDSPRQLKMSEAAKQLAKIQTAPVRRAYLEHELRLVGKVEYDETRLRHITAWFPGRLDRLFVDYTGTPVAKGDHLAEIYSPALISDQEALLQAARAAGGSPRSTVSQVRENRLDTLERARERLRLLGLTGRQIDEIEERGDPSELVTFYSPIDGIVIDKLALEGDYVQTGTRIYTIADLTRLWVRMDAYESDLQWIHYGQDVEFTTVSYPGETFRGRVSFIDPFLNEQTRTVKVRVNVDNPDGKLKPEMFVRAVLRAKVDEEGLVYGSELAGKWISPMHPEIVKDGPGSCDVCGMPLVRAETLGFVDADGAEGPPPLVIPDSAPLITGKRAVVYVKVPGTDRPTYEGREIVLGPRLRGHYMVRSGLEEGEEVVSRGAFKIDSALQIQAKPSMMTPPDVLPGAGPEEEGGEIPIPAEALNPLVSAYLETAEALALDDWSGAREAAAGLEEAANTHSLPELAEKARGIRVSEDIERARSSFETVSNALIAALERHGAPLDTLYEIHCPMAFENKGASWIQEDEEVRNPYFGASMLKCGYTERTFEPREGGEPALSMDQTSALLALYPPVSQALVAGDLESAAAAAREMRAKAAETGAAQMAEFAQQIADAGTLEEARLAFSVVSETLIAAVEGHGSPGGELYLAHCPMAFQNRGAGWLQWNRDIRNPYFGDAMLTCGEIQKTFPPAGTGGTGHRH